MNDSTVTFGIGTLMELLGQGARFYELLGYFLAVSSFGILAAGIVWRLRRYIAVRYRLLFMAGSATSIVVVCSCLFAILVWTSVPVAPGVMDRPQKRIRRRDDVEPVGESVQMVEVLITAEGALVHRGETLQVADVIAIYRRRNNDPQLHVTIRASRETPYAQVVSIIDELQNHGVERFTIVPSD